MARVALVTGGSRGIGAAISKKLQADGFQVAATYAGNDEAAAAFTAETGIKTYKWNVASYEESAAGIAQVTTDLGAIEVVVANAGITKDAPFHKMTPEMWNQVIDTNLTGVFNTVHPIWPSMRENKFGRVIVISSINGQKGQFAQVNYAATKAGDLGIVKSLAQEGARAGITANAVCPGYIATEMVMAVPEKVRDSIISQIPAGRLGEP
ncbi:SDR family NAD(P)-dependent oxidoreductase, partial [Planktotalea frisia]